jgi:hypothetical protein
MLPLAVVVHRVQQLSQYQLEKVRKLGLLKKLLDILLL